MASKGKTIGLWVLSGLLAFAFLGAGGSKLAGAQMHLDHFAKWGYPDWFRIVVGVIETGGAVALMIPKAAFYASLLLAVTMLGAIYTHATNAEAEQIAAPLVLLVLNGVVAFIRRPTR